MNTGTPAYGLWTLVILNTVVFVLFALSFVRPRTKLDWRSFGIFAAFLVALFTEMYGFPLTIFLLSGWLGNSSPGVDLLSHNNGHLWSTLLGWKGDPHFSPFHLLSYILISGGFLLISTAWEMLYKAQSENRLAVNGPYAYVRHPQYVGFILIMFGFLFQWPTLITLVMFPILIVVYMRLARREEREVIEQFGNEYLTYAKSTPAFLPHLNRTSDTV